MDDPFSSDISYHSINAKVDALQAKSVDAQPNDYFLKSLSKNSQNHTHVFNRTQTLINNLEEEINEVRKEEKKFAKTQIQNLNENTFHEKVALDHIQEQINQEYDKEITENNIAWEKAIFQAHEEEEKYRSLIDKLNMEITVAKGGYKSDFSKAQKRASEFSKQIQDIKQQQINELSCLTDEIKSENTKYLIEIQNIHKSNEENFRNKKGQIEKLQKTLFHLQRKLKAQDSQYNLTFKDKMNKFNNLKNHLQRERLAEKDRHNELIYIQNQCENIQKNIYARVDETTSIKHQISLVNNENYELQNQIIKLERQLFPQVFHDPKFNFNYL